MVKRNFSDFLKNKGFYLAIGVCALAIVAVAGVVKLQSREQDQQLAENAVGFEDVPEDKEADAVTDHRTADNDYDMDYTEGYDADEVQDVLDQLKNNALETTDETPEKTADEDAVSANAKDVSAKTSDSEAIQSTLAGFDDTQKMHWPVEGAILLDYSMDTTVYYTTLDQYKCNPGMLIAVEANTPVGAAFDGEVISVINDAAKGNVVTVDMGNGYKASYAQLKDMTVGVGDVVSKGQSLGTVSMPTKYFKEEGSHLYFEITKDGKPVDPKTYME